MDQCETNENTQLAITTKGFSAVCSVRLILAIYLKYIANSNNPFSIEESNGNVINVYFYPLGIALCERGNHSQLSAKLKGVGEISIERIMNIEHVYDHVNYDGIYFYHIFSENEETNPYRFKAQNRT